MKKSVLLMLPLMLCACGEGAATVVGGCTEQQLNEKIEKFSAASAKLVETVAANYDDEKTARNFEAFSRKMTGVGLAMTPAHTTVLQLDKLCKAYDELQAAADKALAGELASESAEPAAAEDAPASAGNDEQDRG